MNKKIQDKISEENVTTIDQLPSELLQPIVKYLPYKDRMNVAEVSVRWHTIVDQHLGRKLFVGMPCQSLEDEERYKHHYVPIANLQKVGVNSLYVGEIVDPIKTVFGLAYYWMKFKENIFGPNLPKLKYPHLVKNIFFDGPIPQRHFSSIVKPAKNLERLDIHLTALSCLSHENMNLSECPRLQTLNIWGHKLTQGMFSQFYSTTQIISNLIVLLDNNTFPNLKHLAMEYPFDLRDESKLTESFLEFLKKHKNTLEKLKLSINVFSTEDPSNFESADDRVWIQKAKTVSRILNLKSVEFNITSLFRVRLSRMWIGFIESQSALDSASVMTFHLQPDILFRICEQNFKAIQQIALTRLILIENGRFMPINCSVFERCTNLQHLFLEAMLHGPLTAGFINTAALPKTLSRIELGGLRVTSEDAHTLLTELPNLQDVFLFDLGYQEGFGITEGTMIQVLEERIIKNITMYGSLNQYPEEGLSNGNPTRPEQIICRPYGIFEIKLNDEGYYAMVPHLAVPDMILEDID